MKTRTSVLAVAFMALVSAAQAENPPASLVMIPPQINYQGRLMTPTNSPYRDATHTIDLSLYPTASGGAKMWSERYAVPTKDGYFSVSLGSGGAPLLASNNLPLWQVLWKADGASPDNFFMALTVRTDPNGNPLANPAEATPRQQFLTAPFAYRAHQSVYATKADGLFSAPQGVQTPSLFSPTNEIEVNVPLRMETVFANIIRAHGGSPSLKLLSSGPLYVGVDYGSGRYLVEHASTINIGAKPSTFPAVAGSDISVDGRTVDISTPGFTFNTRPMFIRRNAYVLASTTSTSTEVAHGINLNYYDVLVIGWRFAHNQTSPSVRGVTLFSQDSSASVWFSAIPSGGTVIVDFLGIAKGLTDNP